MTYEDFWPETKNQFMTRRSDRRRKWAARSPSPTKRFEDYYNAHKD